MTILVIFSQNTPNMGKSKKNYKFLLLIMEIIEGIEYLNDDKNLSLDLPCNREPQFPIAEVSTLSTKLSVPNKKFIIIY